MLQQSKHSYAKIQNCMALLGSTSELNINKLTTLSTTPGGSNSRKSSNRRGVTGASRKATIGDGGITVGLSGNKLTT
jgi:hypothetical protein